MKCLENKVAIVAENAGSIGRATAEAYTEHGGHMVVADINFKGARAVSGGINASARRIAKTWRVWDST
jgi:NAD(P)-dependent dehydrogenase (short-subunit alcohol dehydrogenase family)